MFEKAKRFQFTPLREGRRNVQLLRYCYKDFNSRPSARGDTAGIPRHNGDDGISIHAPPRGATSAANVPREQQQFQFTPLREGRLKFCSCGRLLRRISIHAPPRGATYCFFSTGKNRHEFQFTPLREGRRLRRGEALALDIISIHAPPRGATNSRLRIFMNKILFQFTPLREGRLWHSA